ncbi:MAG: CaiB/BaiF CoA transferase family protein [Myxococcota bacterium]
MSTQQMLDGIRILDLSRLLPGPACTWYLQGLGASVDRIEPLGGDLARHIPPFVDGVGVYFRCFAQGKRSLTLDTRQPEAQSLIRKLLPHYDVLVEGFKPGVLETMGLEPDQLLREHAHLVIARLSGYGQSGPMRDRPGHDINYISLTGLLSAQAVHEDQLALPAVQIADMCGALTAAMSISAALVKRFRTGKGQVIDVSLTDSALALSAPLLAGAIGESRLLKAGGEALSGGASFYRCYRCADGRWVAVGAIEPKFQKPLLDRFGGLSEETLAMGFQKETSDYWEEALKEACVTKVRTAEEAVQDEHFVIRGRVRNGQVLPPIGDIRGKLSAPGEDGRAILRDAGVHEKDIVEALTSGALSLD